MEEKKMEGLFCISLTLAFILHIFIILDTIDLYSFYFEMNPIMEGILKISPILCFLFPILTLSLNCLAWKSGKKSLALFSAFLYLGVMILNFSNHVLLWMEM